MVVRRGSAGSVQSGRCRVTEMGWVVYASIVLILFALAVYLDRGHEIPRMLRLRSEPLIVLLSLACLRLVILVVYAALLLLPVTATYASLLAWLHIRNEQDALQSLTLVTLVMGFLIPGAAWGVAPIIATKTEDYQASAKRSRASSSWFHEVWWAVVAFYASLARRLVLYRPPTRKGSIKTDSVIQLVALVLNIVGRALMGYLAYGLAAAGLWFSANALVLPSLYSLGVDEGALSDASIHPWWFLCLPP